MANVFDEYKAILKDYQRIIKELMEGKGPYWESLRSQILGQAQALSRQAEGSLAERGLTKSGLAGAIERDISQMALSDLLQKRIGMIPSLAEALVSGYGPLMEYEMWLKRLAEERKLRKREQELGLLEGLIKGLASVLTVALLK